MKLSYLLLCMVHNSDKMIKNIHLPACRNCVYYKPNYWNDFTSNLNKCEKFGEKDIVTDIITYKYADMCREDDAKCGKEGKYFEQEKEIEWKVFQHGIVHNLPYILPVVIVAIFTSLK